MSGLPGAKTAIVGAGTFGAPRCPGHEPLDMAAIASRNALLEACLTFADVDGLFYTGSDDTFGGAMNLAQYCGIPAPKVLETAGHRHALWPPSGA